MGEVQPKQFRIPPPTPEQIEALVRSIGTPTESYTISGIFIPDDPRVPGEYEVRGDGLHSGLCAKCCAPVNEGDPYVILYHPTERGGIFHAKCEPQGAGWYGVEEGE